jgi:hypothetical protein
MSIGQSLWELSQKDQESNKAPCDYCVYYCDLPYCICDEEHLEEKQDDFACSCYHLNHCVC